MTRTMKSWRCKNGHILGMIERNGNDVPSLALYRHAVDSGQDLPEEVDVLGPLLGRMPVRCDICGQVQLWDVSLAALVALSDHFERNRLETFLARVSQRRVSRRG